jgi:HEAT repeat protein/beta-lactamase regulating signal transducer with metallopeptidase domain
MSALADIISSDSLTALLASAALKGSLLLLAALLVDLALRRYTAALRHRVWTAAFAALLLVPLAMPLAPNWNLPLLPEGLAPSAESESRGIDPATRPSQPASRRDDVESTTAPGRSAIGAESSSRRGDAMPARAGVNSWTTLVVAAWGAGAILLLVSLATAAARASLLCRRARRLDDPAWNDLLKRVRERLGLRVPVRLVRSDTLQVPMVWGIRRHHVVLPADAERWSNERREVVLLHELAHVRRADCLSHLLSSLVAALYWPHPLVWIARRRQAAERELACDDTVLTSGARGADYAWHVLEIARASDNRLSLAPVGVSMARKSQLEGRVLAALDDSRDRRPLSRLGEALPTVAGLVMVVALAGLQPWASEEVAAQQPAAPAPVPSEATALDLQTRERVVQMMAGLLDDPDVSIRAQAVASLGRMEDAASVASLSDTMVNDEDANVRAQAAWALGMIESPDAVASLGRALSDADANVRSQAAWALGMIESPDGVAPLVPALDDAEFNVRERAAWALGMIESADAVAGLVNRLREDAAPSVREQAAWALGMIEDETALEGLIDAVEDENPAVRRQALWAISRIVG